jgi:hypothetical protein
LTCLIFISKLAPPEQARRSISIAHTRLIGAIIVILVLAGGAAFYAASLTAEPGKVASTCQNFLSGVSITDIDVYPSSGSSSSTYQGTAMVSNMANHNIGIAAVIVGSTGSSQGDLAVISSGTAQNLNWTFIFTGSGFGGNGDPPSSQSLVNLTFRIGQYIPNSGLVQPDGLDTYCDAIVSYAWGTNQASASSTEESDAAFCAGLLQNISAVNIVLVDSNQSITEANGSPIVISEGLIQLTIKNAGDSTIALVDYGPIYNSTGAVVASQNPTQFNLSPGNTTEIPSQRIPFSPITGEKYIVDLTYSLVTSQQGNTEVGTGSCTQTVSNVQTT